MNTCPFWDHVTLPNGSMAAANDLAPCQGKHRRALLARVSSAMFQAPKSYAIPAANMAKPSSMIFVIPSTIAATHKAITVVRII